MTIILFLVDTSASMRQRAAVGTHFVSYIDLAKEAIEAFIKLRVKNPASRLDRYMLLTFDDFPLNIKAGWKENMATFTRELNNLQCNNMSNLRQALINAFAVLNLNRVQTSVDNYGRGRCPVLLEPAIIIVITDGGKFVSPSQCRLGLGQDLNLPMPLPIPGPELTYEPFRWDQRVFSLVLRMPGAPIGILDCDAGIIPRDNSPINGFCEATGGRSYRISTHRMLMQCIESLIFKVQRGIVVCFEKIGSDPPFDPALSNKSRASSGPTNWHTCRTLLQVPVANHSRFATDFWPIPESFWPDQFFRSLPQRSAQPVIQFSCTNQKPLVLGNLPVDKYVLEPSHLTRYILSRKQPEACWQVFMANSCRSTSPQVGFPFGYLKANTNLTGVQLYVLPYNYPVVLPLLDTIFKTHCGYPTEDWIVRFKAYLRNMPFYYADPMRQALIRLGLPEYLARTLIPTEFEAPINQEVLSNLKQITVEAKAKLNELCMAVATRVSSNNLLVSKQAQSVNPFDFERASLCDELVRLRSMFFHPFTRQPLNEPSVACNRMGDYSSYILKKTLPLRELEPSPITQTKLFGNPFKRDKKMIVDETDVVYVKCTRQQHDRPLSIQHFPGRNMLHRKRGPIPKHATVSWTKHQPTSASPSSEQPVLQPTLQLDGGVDLPTCASSNLTELSMDGVAPSCLFPKLHQEGEDTTLTELSLNNGSVEFVCRSRKPTRVRDKDVHMNCTALGCSTKSEQNHILTQNKSVMLLIKKEIRKPGKISAQLIPLIKSLQGNYSMKVKLLGVVIKELQRFKRRIMIEQVKNVFHKEMKDVIVDYTGDENYDIQQALHIEPRPNESTGGF